MRTTSNKEKRIKRHKRIRSQVKGTGIRPRLSVFRSNKYVWAQIIDDETGKTLVAASSRDLSAKKPLQRTLAAGEVGEKIAGAAVAKEIRAVVFDRGGYRYHGIIKAIADGARKGGLTF